MHASIDLLYSASKALQRIRLESEAMPEDPGAEHACDLPARGLLDFRILIPGGSAYFDRANIRLCRQCAEGGHPLSQRQRWGA
jgi:hypothetical protein